MWIGWLGTTVTYFPVLEDDGNVKKMLEITPPQMEGVCQGPSDGDGPS